MHIVIDSFLETEKKTDSSVKPAPATVSKRKVYSNTTYDCRIWGSTWNSVWMAQSPIFLKFYEKSKCGFFLGGGLADLFLKFLIFSKDFQNAWALRF